MAFLMTFAIHFFFFISSIEGFGSLKMMTSATGMYEEIRVAVSKLEKI